MSKVILVPLDGSEVAASILQQVVAMARSAEARLVLFTVGLLLPVPPAQASELSPSRTFQAEAYLDHIRTYVANEGLEVSTMVCIGDPATEILRCAAQQQVDRIVINSRGGGGSSVPFLGSVAKKVAAAATVPVTVFYT
jgi:nucleotide-binding universal stress UspA family protein